MTNPCTCFDSSSSQMSDNCFHLLFCFYLLQFVQHINGNAFLIDFNSFIIHSSSKPHKSRKRWPQTLYQLLIANARRKKRLFSQSALIWNQKSLSFADNSSALMCWVKSFFFLRILYLSHKTLILWLCTVHISQKLCIICALYSTFIHAHRRAIPP